MPWTVSDVDRHKKGLTKAQKKKWVKIANAALATCLADDGEQSDCEGKAIRIANAGVGKPKANVSGKGGALKLNMEKDGLKYNGLIHLMSTLIHHDTYEGEDHLVIPTVLMVEGVHNDIFYSGDELAMFPQAWNGVPVTSGHPKRGGKFVSANDPSVLQAEQIGRLFNSWYESEGKRLHSEVWLNVDRCTELAPEVLAKIYAEEDMDVSTGVYIEEDGESGEWGIETYTAAAKHMRPDHFAILPNEQGACSWADGAGLPRLNFQKKEEENAVNRNGEDGKPKETDGTPEPNKETPEQKGRWNRLRDRFHKLISFKTLELSHDEIRMQLGALVDKQNEDGSSVTSYSYVSEIFDDYLVYSQELGGERKLFKQNYTVDGDDNVTLTGDRVEVKQEITYTPVVNESSTTTSKGGQNMERKEQVQALIDKGVWQEEDRQYLMDLEDDRFRKVELSAVESIKPPTEEPAKPADTEDTQTKEPEVEEPKKAHTAEEYLAQSDMPENLKEMFNDGLKLHKDKKGSVIKALLAIKGNSFSEKELNAKKLDELEKLAQLASIPRDYSGRVVGEVDTNVEDSEGNGPGPAPKMNFDEKD